MENFLFGIMFDNSVYAPDALMTFDTQPGLHTEISRGMRKIENQLSLIKVVPAHLLRRWIPAICGQLRDLDMTPNELSEILKNPERMEILILRGRGKRIAEYSLIFQLCRWIDCHGTALRARWPSDSLLPPKPDRGIDKYRDNLMRKHCSKCYERVLVPETQHKWLDGLITPYIEGVAYMAHLLCAESGTGPLLGDMIPLHILEYVGFHNLILPEVYKHYNPQKACQAPPLLIFHASEFRGIRPFEDSAGPVAVPSPESDKFYKILRARYMQSQFNFDKGFKDKEPYGYNGPLNPRYLPFKVEGIWRPPQGSSQRFAIYKGTNRYWCGPVPESPSFIVIDYKLQIMFLFCFEYGMLDQAQEFAEDDPCVNSLPYTKGALRCPAPNFWPKQIRHALLLSVFGPVFTNTVTPQINRRKPMPIVGLTI